MATACRQSGGDKKPWWLGGRKIVDKYIREARSLIATQKHEDILDALKLIETALSVSPTNEVALELKGRALLVLRRFKDVADMLQDCIPSLKMANEEQQQLPHSSCSSDIREKANLLSPHTVSEPISKCFGLKSKVKSMFRESDKEGHWRYVILGRACCHLGLMEDAMVLLQTGKRISTESFRRQSVTWSDDCFSSADSVSACKNPQSDFDCLSNMISHIKLLLRRRSAAVAALDAGLHSEAIRHFTKIVESRRGAPQGFLSECYLHRASAYESAGRIAESIADCNKALALEPACIPALEKRSALLESIRCLPESLHDLEHLKLLYNSILRDRKLPGPAWKQVNLRYREIPGKLCALATKMQELKRRLSEGESAGNSDYFALMGLQRGCTRSELDRAHRLLCLRHKPDKSTSFMERCEFADDRDLDDISDRAKISALQLYRLIQRGYSKLAAAILEDEAATSAIQHKHQLRPAGCPNPAVFQGVFCRDMAAVGNLLSRFNRPMLLKCEALSC